jgi:hypothetical protein
MKKTIVGIERINDCIPKPNIAKSGFYNFESDAFNHSATLPASVNVPTRKYLSRIGWLGQAHSVTGDLTKNQAPLFAESSHRLTISNPLWK